MALEAIAISIPAVATGASEVRTKDGGAAAAIMTTLAGHAASLATHIATAVGIGSGDASVPVGLASTDSTNITADAATLTAILAGDVVVLYDPAVLTTPNQGRAVLAAFAARLRARGLA